ANVFLYAYLKPKRRLKEHEVKLKENAKEIVKRINEGEFVFISTVHFSEIVNILEDNAPLDVALEVEESILLRENIRFIDVSKKDYLNAIEVAKKFKVGLNDALAYVAMKRIGIDEIYTFDKDFDRLPDVKRIINL
nr:type II toxin-antitoxin system VapC family toxin [Candidatus Baldrarchaeota archaeon]